MRDAYGDALARLGSEMKDIVVLGADTTGSIKTSIFGQKFPERFFNVGIAEQNLVSVAAGLAMAGKISFASTYAVFAPGKCVDQMRNAIAYPEINVKLVSSHAGVSVGPDGASHQELEDIATMRSDTPHEGLGSIRCPFLLRESLKSAPKSRDHFMCGSAGPTSRQFIRKRKPMNESRQVRLFSAKAAMRQYFRVDC